MITDDLTIHVNKIFGKSKPGRRLVNGVIVPSSSDSQYQ